MRQNSGDDLSLMPIELAGRFFNITLSDHALRNIQGARTDGELAASKYSKHPRIDRFAHQESKLTLRESLLKAQTCLSELVTSGADFRSVDLEKYIGKNNIIEASLKSAPTGQIKVEFTFSVPELSCDIMKFTTLKFVCVVNTNTDNITIVTNYLEA